MPEPGFSREQLASQVDGLAAVHQGTAFVEEISRLARELDEGGRHALQEILLERGAEEERRRAVRRRAETRGWLRRTLKRAEERASELKRRRG